MITARKFFEELQTKLYKSDAMYEGDSYDKVYIRSKRYTKLINKEIVPAILRAHNMSVSYEYYRTDVSGWSQKPDNTLEKEFLKFDMKWHSWKLNFVFEHENNYRDWNDEIIKLLYLNCPLRVVVGYNDADKRNDILFGDCHKLDIISKVIANLNIEIKDEFLIIIGNRGKGFDISHGIENFFGYKAYLYDSNLKSFQLM